MIFIWRLPAAAAAALSAYCYVFPIDTPAGHNFGACSIKKKERGERPPKETDNNFKEENPNWNLFNLYALYSI